jgi:hypothetical protein
MGSPVRGTSDRETRRNTLRRRRRRNRRLALIGAAAAVLVVIAVAESGLGGGGGRGPSSTVAASSNTTSRARSVTGGGPATTDTATRAATAPAEPKPKTTAKTAPAKTTAKTTPERAAATTTARSTTIAAATRPATPTLAVLPIHQDPIPYGAERRAEMAAYSARHYGIDSSKLDPKMIVLHYTAGDTYQSAWSTFAANTPAPGPAGSATELPGTCAHFIVDQAGTIHQLVPLTVQCRHTIGVNRWAIGIEMVQNDAGHDSTWATDQILHRKPQIAAVLALVRALMARYELSKSDVIGHGMANDDPRFVDLEGWRNDHTDWLAPAVRALRERL